MKLKIQVKRNSPVKPALFILLELENPEIFLQAFLFQKPLDFASPQLELLGDGPSLGQRKLHSSAPKIRTPAPRVP